MAILCHTCLHFPPTSLPKGFPNTSLPKGLPDATEAPEAVQFSKVTALSASWEKLPPILRPPPLGTQQTPKNAVRGSKLLLQRPQPNPQNLVENLNSEEPANAATPSIPDPELCRSRCASGAWLNYGKLPARSHWRQSQEHCCPGSQARTAAAEDGRAVGCLFEVFFHASTAAFTWETAGAQTRGVEFRGFLCTMPKALHGRAATP